jgi:Icc-related predicted phosphoesterase
MFENRGIKYLEDSGTTIEGLKIYGTPWTRVYTGNAFQIEEDQLLEKFEKIPSNLDILISHSPPQNIFDRNSKGVASGSSSLLKILTKTKPRIHVFGHIHEGHGTSEKAKPNEPYFINAAIQKVVDLKPKPSRMTKKEWMIFQKRFPPMNLPVILQIKLKNKK